MINQCHRKFISYSFGYTAEAGLDLAQREFFEISASYPMLN
jgi:hypothetical protein